MNLEEEARRLGGVYTPPSPNAGVPTVSPELRAREAGGSYIPVPTVSPELEMAEEAKRLGGTYTPPGPTGPGPFTRAVGLSARAGGRALLTAGGLSEMVGDAIPGLQNRVGPSSDWILDAAGFPRPETPGERIAQRMAGGMAGVGVTGAAAAAARPATPLLRELAEMLSRRIHTQVGSVAGGAGAGGVVHERGGGPGQELAASVVGSLVAPGAAAGRQAVAQRLAPVRAEYAGVGTEPSLGQLTQSRIVQNFEELGMNLPVSRMIIEGERRRQQGDIGQFANRAAWETEVPPSMADPMRATNREGWLPELGRAPPSQQDAAGTRFSTESFLDRWQAIPREAVQDPGMRRDFERIGRVAQEIRTTRENTVLARQRGRWSGPLGLVASGVIGGAGLPALILGSMAAGSKLVTHRPFIRWLADASESQGGDMPRRMQQLRVMTNVERDPDTRAAMEEYTANLVEKLTHPEGAMRNE